jgi:diguanylate cyclase (GGDEF)-like protein
MFTPQDLDGESRVASQKSVDGRLTRRSRLAGAGLVLVLLGVSTFAMWSSVATSAAVHNAVRANAVSDEFARAAVALGDEESLEREYRLEQGTVVRDLFDGAAAALVAALEQVRRDGSADDRLVVDEVLIRHIGYLSGIDRTFDAVDRGDTDGAQLIDSGEVERAFDIIEGDVRDEAAARHGDFLDQVARLNRLNEVTRRLTPLVFIAGLAVAAILASITRGHRRLLGIERTRAVRRSLHDDLTGLPNRTLLATRCEQALQADVRNATRSALLLIDLDRFKEINDTFGHHYGDELLSQVGPRLAQATRPSDTVARLGGDEFAVLLTNVDGVSGAFRVATKIREALQAPFHVAGVDLDVEASIGLVTSGEHGRDPSTLLQHADIAMYVAKSRNCGVFAYDPTVDGHSPAKLALLGDLRRGLERGELLVHYQPKVSLSTGEFVGVEALARWQHPIQGLILPNDFIPLAEHTGLIAPLTRYVLDIALAQARTWLDSGQRIPVSVNLSARNLLDTTLPHEIATQLANHGVPADLLEIEVTESALMTDPARAQWLLEQLFALGIRIAIDDFGAGYTSLGQLRTLPVSELKIDRSFVTSMDSDSGSAVIVQSVVDLGHNLGLTIIAEGVESERVMNALSQIGCDVAQGYFISRPGTAAAVDTWRAARRADTMPSSPSLTLL